MMNKNKTKNFFPCFVFDPGNLNRGCTIMSDLHGVLTSLKRNIPNMTLQQERAILSNLERNRSPKKKPLWKQALVSYPQLLYMSFFVIVVIGCALKGQSFFLCRSRQAPTNLRDMKMVGMDIKEKLVEMLDGVRRFFPAMRRESKGYSWMLPHISALETLLLNSIRMSGPQGVFNAMLMAWQSYVGMLRSYSNSDILGMVIRDATAWTKVLYHEVSTNGVRQSLMALVPTRLPRIDNFRRIAQSPSLALVIQLSHLATHLAMFLISTHYLLTGKSSNRQFCFTMGGAGTLQMMLGFLSGITKPKPAPGGGNNNYKRQKRKVGNAGDRDLPKRSKIV